MIIYKRISHPSNIKTWNSYGLLPIYLKRPQVYLSLKLVIVLNRLRKITFGLRIIVRAL
jgi:hypothetical protein